MRFGAAGGNDADALVFESDVYDEQQTACLIESDCGIARS
jgi:hypothetical protein